MANPPTTRPLFSFDNVTYRLGGARFSLGKDSKVKPRAILDDVSGTVASGELLAIMGSSGAGKSSLLNVLAGRFSVGTVTGEIKLDGVARSTKTWTNDACYVEQSDVLFDKLSVRETIEYAARLRSPPSTSTKEIKDNVERIIQELGLSKASETYIGNEERRGISGEFFGVQNVREGSGRGGGERRRVSIGVELVTRPRVMFLDEITSGLDSHSAFTVVNIVKKLLEDPQERRCAIMTIHQPSIDILGLIDKFLFMSHGRVVVSGSLQECLTTLENRGHICPIGTNPADFIMNYLIEHPADNNNSTPPPQDPTSVVVLHDEPTAYETQSTATRYSRRNWFAQVGILLGRNLRLFVRDKEKTIVMFGKTVVMLLFMGFLFYKVGNDAAGVQNRLGFLFMLTALLTFDNVMPIIAVFPLEKLVVIRERNAGSYSGTAYYIAKILLEFINSLFWGLVLTASLYWVVGLTPNAEKFGIFLGFASLNVLFATGLGMILGSLLKIETANVAAPGILIIFILFAGMLVNVNTIPLALRWIHWVSPIAYAFKGFVTNEFTGLVISCPETAGQAVAACPPSGDYILDQYALRTHLGEIWQLAAVLGAMGIFCHILAMGGLAWSTRAKLRLK
ncbi:hypothetical protein HDV00_012829 [Rhizophlyctis rosea]|nr:hypothetical protein HDV00_012829 [Rhizophlyctis rosea]